MGFLDDAKKVLAQAKQKAEQTRERAEEALADARARSRPAGTAGRESSVPDVPGGTPYVPGMLGRSGWRERGLADPAAVLPAVDRAWAGVPAGTRSQVVEEPYGMGRRWSAGYRSIALLYQLHPDHEAWQPPAPTQPLTGLPGATVAELPDGRSLVFTGGPGRRTVLEVAGIPAADRDSLARVAAANLAP